MPGESDQHRMLDIVVQGIAVADAIQCKLGSVGQQFAQVGARGAKLGSRFRRQKGPKRLRRQLRDGDHDESTSAEPAACLDLDQASEAGLYQGCC
jgi:hypothetical protein